jgi:hypothetical protein
MRLLLLLAQVEANPAAPHKGFTPADRMKLLVALAILLGLVIVGGVIILMIRRRITADDEDASGTVNAGFSLADLRDMVDRGEMTKEEYEKTRQRIISKVREGADKPQKTKNPRLEE